MTFGTAPDGAKRLHRFGLAIRHQRERKGLTLAAIASAFGYSTSAWSRYENGSPIPPELPARLDELMETHGMFAALWEVIKDEMWPDRYRDYMRLESAAHEVAEYAPYVVPGLLQTPSYARALFIAGHPEWPPERIELEVDARMSRQARFASDDPPYLAGVLDEAVIRRVVGGPAVMREQLERLVPLLDTKHSVLSVAPFSRGTRCGLDGPLILLSLPDNGGAAYFEGMVNGQLLEEPNGVRLCRRAYDRLRVESASLRESTALITAAIKELRP